MSNKNSNFPAAELNRIDKDFTVDTIRKLRRIAPVERPKSNAEVRERIDEYFSFCEAEKIRPGIEGLALALGVTRTTLFNWTRQHGCDAERAQLIQQAKQYIITFLEIAGNTGNLNPPCWIFSMKNVAGWTDQLSIEAVNPNTVSLPSESIEQIVERRRHDAVELPKKPDLD